MTRESERGRSRRAARALSLLAIVAAFGLPACSGLAHASSDAEPTLAACDAAPDHALLQSAAVPAVEHARAIWLSSRWLRWPGRDAIGSFKLYHSARAGIVATHGATVTGADGALALEPITGPLPKSVRARFPHVGAGVTLALDPLDHARIARLHRGQLLLVHEDAGGRVLDATATQAAAALDGLFAAAVDAPALGAHADGSGTRFRLWAPTARRVSLCVYPDAVQRASALLPAQREFDTGIWNAAATADLRGHYTTWLVDVMVPAVGLVRNRVTDPYALSLGPDSRRAYVADLASPALTPEGWHDTRSPARVAATTDMVIYELHVRDFSIGDDSVPAPHRGKYLAFTDTESRGMRHLRALAQAGVTDLHLLPVFDLATVPETGCLTPSPRGGPDADTQQAAVVAAKARDCYNWGYDPFHYSAPEGSYASDAHDGAVRVVEFRRMVQALHRAGLRVGMDVVYNHTSASGQHPPSVLDRIVPGYFQRLDANGTVERSTCCANTATEHPMMERLMIDSVVTWARDYRIDSFRFDLMGHQPRAAMQRLRAAVDAAVGHEVQLLGEGWNFGEVADGARFVQASQLSLAGSGIATFSDRGRDAARGGSAGDNGVDQVLNQGWLNGLHYAPNAMTRGRHDVQALMRAADLVRVGLAGSLRDYEMLTHAGTRVALSHIDYAGQPAGYVSQPGEVVNYVENHDNQTLYDLNAFKLPQDTSASERARVQLLGAALVAFSQGIAYFHAGIDVLRSKSMDRNSYDSGDWFNRLDWSYGDNFFGTGLPPRQDNEASWPWMRPRLADPRLRPAPADIAWTRDAFRDLLRLRASSTLFRLRSADEVKRRLTLLDTGPAQHPTVVVGHLDGRGHDGAGFTELVYLVNADVRAHSLLLASERGKAYRLHPVHRTAGAADQRAATEAAYAAVTGTFTVPARTAVVFVVE